MRAFISPSIDDCSKFWYVLGTETMDKVNCIKLNRMAHNMCSTFSKINMQMKVQEFLNGFLVGANNVDQGVVVLGGQSFGELSSEVC